MTMSLTRSSLPLRDVLYTLSLDERELSADLLDEFIRIYPEHAESLTNFAIELAVDALLADPVIEAAEAAIDPARRSPAVSRAMSRFQNRLYAAQQTASTAETQLSPDSSGASNPFTSLNQKEFRAFAKDLQSSTVFVAKLRDRQIELETMTEGFVRRVAELLKTSIDVVHAHFAAPMHSHLRMQFLKTDQKPVIGLRQAFADAVRSSDLTEDQQRHLLSL